MFVCLTLLYKIPLEKITHITHWQLIWNLGSPTQFKMWTTLNIFWFIAYLASLISSNILCLIIRGYIVSQPQGNQALIVLLMKDIDLGIQFHSTTHCILGLLSRFEMVNESVAEYKVLAAFIGCFTELINTTAQVHLGSVCLTRIIWLKYTTFMEETIGEKIIRLTLFTFSLFMGTLNCITLTVSGDIFNGMVYNMLINRVAESGKENFDSKKHNMYLSVA